MASDKNRSVHSMTGFGESSVECNGALLHCEISSLNHRHFDFNFYGPSSLLKYEALLRQKLKEVITRGRIRVNVHFAEGSDPATRLVYSADNARVYAEAFKSICEMTSSDCPVDPNAILTAPEVVVPVKCSDSLARFEEALIDAVSIAANKLVLMRAEEGSVLADDLSRRMSLLRSILEDIKERIPFVKQHFRERLEERLKEWELEAVISEERVAQELLFHCEKADITEEIVRTDSHIKQFEESLESGSGIGRKLVFITQEMNREATTIGAKASDPRISHAVVLFKEELARVREQAENVE